MEGSRDISSVWEELAQDGGRMVWLVLDGAGGLRDARSGATALEQAKTPNLDELAGASATGLLELVGPGITPGSGPGHLSLFGYDPLRYRIGRGVLSALGIGFDLEYGDVAARINFASLDQAGKVTDRRAGRIATATNEALCEKLRDAVELDFDGAWFLRTVSEHRAVLVLRGDSLDGRIGDTDPQATGVPPRAPEPLAYAARRTAALVESFVAQAREALAGEEAANAVLLRGFQQHTRIPTLAERFSLRGLCIAAYPMYRGLSRLLGMDVLWDPEDAGAVFAAFAAHWEEGHDLVFLHQKGTDKAGEDGDFDAKVAALEATDLHLPEVFERAPDVLVVTSDHSTPAGMAAHSWHPVPVMIRAHNARVDEVRRFNEYACRDGSLGLRPGVHLMGLALAHAGRLSKFGA